MGPTFFFLIWAGGGVNILQMCPGKMLQLYYLCDRKSFFYLNTKQNIFEMNPTLNKFLQDIFLSDPTFFF